MGENFKDVQRIEINAADENFPHTIQRSGSSPNSKISVLIADDHPIFRRGLRQIIEEDMELNIVAEVSNGEDALKKINELQPQVAVLDVDMPKLNGLELAKIIKSDNLATEIIFLTMYKEARFFNLALDVGAKGYLIKDSAINEITNAIRIVAGGQNFISPVLATFLMNRLSQAEYISHQTNNESLTTAEKRVLRLVAEYKTNKQIADELFISVRTVETYRARICDKLGIKGSHALLQFALKNHDKL